MTNKIYLSGALVMGCLIIIDAIIILSGNTLFVNQIFSLIEMCWFFYSLFVAYGLLRNRSKIFASVSYSYLIYYIFGFFIGNYWLTTEGNIDHPPQWYLVFAIIFGAYYATISYKYHKLI
ncbi:MAG: hypothetical protein OEX07_08480 [Gammaproteobacteria bacterium]|nr:hypothetical protein [Gammaproteobacteria bacterium]